MLTKILSIHCIKKRCKSPKLVFVKLHKSATLKKNLWKNYSNLTNILSVSRVAVMENILQASHFLKEILSKFTDFLIYSENVYLLVNFCCCNYIKSYKNHSFLGKF